MLYISNVFTINMLDTHRVLCFNPVGVKAASWIAKGQCKENFKFQSLVGHADMATVISEDLGVEIPHNRISVSLKPEDTLLVAQYKGPRLSEGTTKLPKGAIIEYWMVTNDTH